MKNRNIYLIALLLITAGIFVWWGLRGGEKRIREDVSRNVSSSNAPREGKASSRSAHKSVDAAESEDESCLWGQSSLGNIMLT